MVVFLYSVVVVPCTTSTVCGLSLASQASNRIRQSEFHDLLVHPFFHKIA
jgi:hypothetical protein